MGGSLRRGWGLAGVVGGWEAGSPVGDKEASQCQGRPDPCLGGAVKCSLSWEGKRAQPPCWFSLPPGGRRQPRGEWGGARGLVSSLCPAPADRGPRTSPLGSPLPGVLTWLPSICSVPWLHVLPHFPPCPPRAAEPGFTSPAVPSPSPARSPLALGRREPRATGWGCLGKELLGLAPPLPCSHA